MDRDLYGAQETNGIAPGYHNEPIVATLDWTSPDLAKITRLRLLSDPGYPAWDVSYCHGENRRGERVNVGLPFSQLPRGRAMRGAIIEWARREKVYAKGLGIFEAISTLV